MVTQKLGENFRGKHLQSTVNWKTILFYHYRYFVNLTISTVKSYNLFIIDVLVENICGGDYAAMTSFKARTPSLASGQNCEMESMLFMKMKSTITLCFLKVNTVEL